MWQNLNYLGLLLLVYASLAAAVAEERLYLEIIVNGTSSGKVLEVLHTGTDWQFSYRDLLELGLTLGSDLKPARDADLVALSRIAGASSRYNQELQQLELILPGSMLPLQHLSMGGQNFSANGQRDRGAYVNYDFFSLSGSSAIRQLSAWHELYIFVPTFYLSSSGLVQTRNPLSPGSHYTRFDTRLQWDDEAELRSLTLGDIINATPSWGRSIRMGGIRLARDYELSPNLITYPLPAFYGESALPGSLSLLINDQLRLRQPIASGPFLIDAVPYISGAGTAQVITTDPQGHETKRELDFYISNELLAAGMIDYDLSLGFAREDFGLASDHYGERPVFSGSLRYGFNSSLTPQVLAQGGDGLSLAGAGLTFLAGDAGVVDISHARSHYRAESGFQSALAYNYTRRSLGINGRYLRRSGRYYDLGNLDDSPSYTSSTLADQGNQLRPANQPLQNSEAQLAISFQRLALGTFSLGYFRVTDEARRPVSLAALSWSKYFRSGLSLFFSGSHRLHSEGGSALTLSLSLPFGTSSQLSASTQQDADGQTSQQLQAMRIAPYTGGFGWNLGIDNSNAERRFAVANWRGSHSDLATGYYTSNGQHQYSAELSGALIAMDGGIYTSRTVTDAFALVDTGQQGIPVMAGNQVVGTTNHQGKLLVPDLYSYLENHIAIDPLELPANVALASIEQTLVPRRKGGLHVQFPVTYARSAIVSIYTGPDLPVPVGAPLQTADGSREYLAGWNGEIYIDNLNEPVTLYWAEGQCQVNINPAPDISQVLPKLGPFYCQAPQALPESGGSPE